MYELSKDRYLELKHHCAQYLEWMNEWSRLIYERYTGGEDPTGEKATRRAWLSQTCTTIACTFLEAYDGCNEEERSNAEQVIYHGERPDGRCDVERYRKFFWLLDKKL